MAGRAESAPSASLAITERANELTGDIDLVSPAGIVRLMRGCDAQLFAGYQNFPGLADAEVEIIVDAITALAAEIIGSPCNDSAVVLSGAGTSGRLAFLLVRSFNGLLERNGRTPCFHYLLAGGDPALLRSKELAEDDPGQAMADLQEVELQGNRGRSYSRVLLVGITCGLSATYVAAQLQYAMTRQHYAVVLLGFNPVFMARKSKVPGFGHTFHQIAADLQRLSDQAAPAERRHFILTPVVGPEAIAGSTRLKGGTATKLLLETIFARACALVLQLPFLGASPQVPTGLKGEGAGAGVTTGVSGLSTYKLALAGYEGAYRAAYSAVDPIATVMEFAAESLAAKKSVYYVGAGTDGLVGLIDASEQLPTFGAHPEDVRAFVVGGWGALTPSAKAPHRLKRPSSDPTISHHVSLSRSASQPSGGLEGQLSSRTLSLGGGRVSEQGFSSGLAEQKQEAPASQALVTQRSASLQSSGEGGLDVGESIPGEGMENGGEARGGPFGRMSTEYFQSSVLPHCRNTDTIVLLRGGSELPENLKAAVLARKKRHGGPMVAILEVEVADHDRILCLGTDLGDVSAEMAISAASKVTEELTKAANVYIRVCLPAASAAPLIPGLSVFEELALKLILNVVSTGAHVLRGKVYKSRMVDLRIGNHKLLHRAAGIVESMMGVSQWTAVSCVLRALHGVDDYEGDKELVDEAVKRLRYLPSHDHIATASNCEKVVPIAMLLATGKYSVASAREALQRTPTVRKLLDELVVDELKSM